MGVSSWRFRLVLRRYPRVRRRAGGWFTSMDKPVQKIKYAFEMTAPLYRETK